MTTVVRRRMKKKRKIVSISIFILPRPRKLTKICVMWKVTVKKVVVGTSRKAKRNASYRMQMMISVTVVIAKNWTMGMNKMTLLNQIPCPLLKRIRSEMKMKESQFKSKKNTP